MTWMQLYQRAVLRGGSMHYLMHCGLMAAQASADPALKGKLVSARALQPGMLFDALDSHHVPVPEPTAPQPLAAAN